MKSVFSFLTLAMATNLAIAGDQQYEPLSASVQAALHDAVSDSRPQISSFKDPIEAANWLSDMSARLSKRIPEREYRVDLLRSVHYEATRAGLDPQMVLGLIEVESAFRKYAVSVAGARGYMQVMPFWLNVLERPKDNLFDMRTNLRYGCTILRHYIDIEQGDLFRALGRYNGSLGRAEYPNLVKNAWNKWLYTSETLTAEPETPPIAEPAPVAETSPAPTTPPSAETTPKVAENVYVYPTTVINQIEEQRVIVAPNYHRPPPPPPPQQPPRAQPQQPQTLKERNTQRVQEIQQKARNASGLNPTNNPRLLNQQNQQTPQNRTAPPPQNYRTAPPPPTQNRGYYAPF